MHLICLLVVHFNSIKVQLKLFKLIVMDISLKFQFHKGTIKTAYGRSPCVLQRDFNSIKVQLKPFITTPFGSKQYTFQFHKGTIKTFLEVLNFCVVYEFQFHKGTIKTCNVWCRLLLELQFQFHKGTIKTGTAYEEKEVVLNFNSIKVQLKPLFTSVLEIRYLISIP